MKILAVALLALAAFTTLAQAQGTGWPRMCSECGRRVYGNPEKCPYCGAQLPPRKPPPQQTQKPPGYR